MKVKDLLAAIERLRAKGLTDETLILIQVFTSTGVAEEGLASLSFCQDVTEHGLDETYLALVGNSD